MLFTQESGETKCEMAMVYKFGPTPQSMRVNGSMTKLTGMASYTMRMVTHTKESGGLTKQTVKDYTLTRTVLLTMATGLMINNMGVG